MMRQLVIWLVLMLSIGCKTALPTGFEVKVAKLEQDIELLKLQIRKEKLTNELEYLESEG